MTDEPIEVKIARLLSDHDIIIVPETTEDGRETLGFTQYLPEGATRELGAIVYSISS